MGLATAFSRAEAGLDAPRIAVEVHLRGGLPGVAIVGLPEIAVRESKDRVRSALVNSQFEFPAQRITVNLAPADLPKEGGRYDLAIAVALLRASGQLPDSFGEMEFLGELSLGGDIRPVRGLLPALIQACSDRKAVVVPAANAGEASLLRDASVYTADHLLQVCSMLRGDQELDMVQHRPPAQPQVCMNAFHLVRGQLQARRALVVAAAGGHSLLMSGPPGSGKSLLASCLPALLPPLLEAEMLEVAKLPASAVAAAAGGGDAGGGGSTLSEGRRCRLYADGSKTFSCTPPYSVSGGLDRWRQGSATRRGFPGPRRCIISGRAAGV